MGIEANAVELGNGEVKLVKLEEIGANTEAKNVVKLSAPLKIPVSTDVRDEGIHIPSDFISQGTVLTSPPESAGVDAAHGSPCTPKGGFFNPFAPAGGELMMAPRGSKHSQEARSSIRRSINFDSSVKVMMDEFDESDADIASVDERLLKLLYDDLLEVIVSTQVYSAQHDTCLDDVLVKHVILDGFKTPEPLLTGIADTCPPAPVRPARRAVNMERGLCKKLDFNI